MSLPLLLITGGTGYVGSHVLQQAVDLGYPVRAISRPPKAEGLRKMYGSKVEVVVIDDIGTADFAEALKGVGAVIHVATPLPGRESIEQTIKTAVNGAMHLLRQATEAGVSRFVLTSSIAAVMKVDDTEAVFGEYTYTEADWTPVTVEQALNGNEDAWYSYITGKTVAEKEVWKFSEEHPEIDITTMCPPFVYGPFVPGFLLKTGDLAGMATVAFFYENVMKGKKLGASQLPHAPMTVDVRDLGKAHVLALTAPPSAVLGKRKRLIVAGKGFFWADAVERIAETRPELTSRLSNISDVVKLPVKKIDPSLAAEVLGLTEYIDWKKTVDDMVTSILSVEESWRMEGWEIPN